MSNIYVTFKIRYIELIYLYLVTKFTAAYQARCYLKDFWTQINSHLKNKILRYIRMLIQGQKYYFIPR